MSENTMGVGESPRRQGQDVSEPPESRDPKRPEMKVLILGGGGTLGAFSAGALLALEGLDWKPDVLIGSSAGGINLLRTTVGGAPAAADFWLSMRWPRLLGEALTDNPFNGGVLGEERFYQRVEQGIDFEAMLRDERVLSFLVVDLENGQVSLRGNRSEPSAALLRGVSRGAYALPPLMPPIRVAGKLLGDGGLLHNAPLEMSLRLGATQIVYLCNVQATPYEGFGKTSTLPVTMRYADIFFRRASNVGFADAQIVEGTYHGIPFLTIAPPAVGGIVALVKAMSPTRRQLESLVRLGQEQARIAIQKTPWLQDRRAT